jgi:hypothetical protein
LTEHDHADRRPPRRRPAVRGHEPVLLRLRRLSAEGPAGGLSPRTIRRAFPHFYLFVIVTAAAAAALLARTDHVAALGLAAVAATTVPTRQLLMPAINHATDAGDKPRFSALHGLSVAFTLAHIAAIGWVIVRLSG